LDNREEIARELGLTAPLLSGLSDGDLIHLAYMKWGACCSGRLYGDWSFAAWHSVERRLFMARDHFGITALYYTVTPQVFAFASSRQALLALNLIPVTLDELYLAQVITSWQAYHGERTIHTSIRRLPPAHRLSISEDCLTVQQYWFLEETPELYLPQRSDYVAAFRELFDDAVKARLRSPAGDGTLGEIASTLSGGLDSSAVTATAADFLRRDGKRVAAYTSVPLYETGSYVQERFGDEFPLAQSTASVAGNVDLYKVTAANCSPIKALRNMLQIHNEPAHAADNFFWLLDLMRTARDNDSDVLLIGQFGNVGVSWTGDIFSQPLSFQVQQVGWRRLLKEQARRTMPTELLKLWHSFRSSSENHYHTSSINLEFAERLQLRDRRLADPDGRPVRSALDLRRFLLPGRCMVGAMYAEMGAAYGLEIRDPTADPRVLAYTFSVPDRIFIDPVSGMDRWLIRTAMEGRVPDAVRLNRGRGRQAGDLVPRLRVAAAEVDTTLTALELGPAAEYLNLPHMRQVWRMVQTDDTAETLNMACTVLMRGIMAGLFVNDFYS
jgi:asparagine synthase (glutamine-hydrolysing)